MSSRHPKPFKQVNIRLPLDLYTQVEACLYSPLYLKLPYGKVQEFVTAAIVRELEARGAYKPLPPPPPCEPSPSTSSSTPSGTIDAVEFF